MGETDNEQRFQSYLDAMADLELGDLTPYVARCLFNPTDGYEATTAAGQRGGVYSHFVCNDMNAVGAMKMSAGASAEGSPGCLYYRYQRHGNCLLSGSYAYDHPCPSGGDGTSWSKTVD